jgi:lactoylglutathione lyase/methylmalonyl-CoA/ethylmalonyl-CoA epimerase
VENIDAELADMREKGAPVLDTQPRIAAEGRAIFLHPKGTNGVLLELLEKS